jgi:HEAT repeats
MGYLVYVFVALALAILAMAVPVVHAWIHDCNVSALNIRIKSNPTASSGAIAAQKLLALSDPRAIEAARNLMLGYGENFEAARTVIASLQSTPYPQWIELLIELSLQHENSDIRYLALGALENVRQTERTLNIFRQLFRDPDPAVARISAWVLAKTGHGEAIAYLMESAIPDSEIEKVAQPVPGASVYAPTPFPDQATNGFFSSKLSDVDAFKLGMHVLRRMDEYSTEVVNDLFHMRNRGTYLAMALSLEEGVCWAAKP